MQAVVIGGGVSGLTTAIRLQEAGWRVRIWSAALPSATTSSVAAALWYPYKAYPEDQVLGWSQRSYAVLTELAEQPQTGVVLREGVEIWRDPIPDPWWRSAVPSFGRCTAADLPPGYRDGYLFTVPIIEMPVYLAYLLQRFEHNGGTLEQREVRTLDQATAVASLVVNCAGLGARTLIGDHEVTPIRGQIVRVRNPGLSRFVLDEGHPAGVTYIVPRTHDCVLGGTSQDDNWHLAPDPPTAEAILQRCIAIEPRLADAEVLEHKVGLRPGRPSIRLEREKRGIALVIHNYGHGGAGVTVSWGCAENVVAVATGD